MQPRGAKHPPAEVLTAYARGRLAEATAGRVARHLEACAGCRDTVEGLRGRPPADTPPPPHGGNAAAHDAPGAAPPGANPPPPAALAAHPKFRVLRLLGKGGMGAVYLAEHQVMGRPVAIKLVNPNLLNRPETLQRFFAEVRGAAKLHHPNIVEAFDAEQAGDLHLFVMEYVDGRNLADYLAGHAPLPVARACDFARQAAVGLQHAHEKGLVHRDIKPHNLMLTREGRVKILDFGLTRLAGEQRDGKGVTQVGAFLGTPEYVAPEQAEDATRADIRADVYSLGCTLYCLLTGRPPFREDTVVKLILAHVGKAPRPVHELRKDVPQAVSDVVARMLEKDPGRRYQEPGEVARALLPFCRRGASESAVSLPASAAARPAAPTPPPAAPDRAPGFRPIPVSGTAPRRRRGEDPDDDSADEAEESGGDETRAKVLAWWPAAAGVAAAVAAGLAIWFLSGEAPKGKTRARDRVVTLERPAVAPPVTETPPIDEKPPAVPGAEATVPAAAPSEKAPRQPDGRCFTEKACTGRLALAPGSPNILYIGWRSVVELDASYGKHLRTADIPGGVQIACSPDGRFWAFAGMNGRLELWTFTPWARKFELNRQDPSRHFVNALAFSPDGSRLLTGGIDYTLRLLDTDKGAELFVPRQYTNSDGTPRSVAFSPDGRFYVAGFSQGGVQVVDAANNHPSKFIKNHTAFVSCVAVAPDNRRVVSGSWDKTLRVSDAQTGQELLAFRGHQGEVECLAVSPDGRRVLSGGRDRVVRLWELDTGREVAKFEGHLQNVEGVAFLPGGREAISGSQDQTIRVWKLP